MKNRFIMTITFILFSLLVLNASADKISLPDKYSPVEPDKTQKWTRVYTFFEE